MSSRKNSHMQSQQNYQNFVSLLSLVLCFLISFSKWILELLEYLIAMTLGCILYFTIVLISGFVTHHKYEQHFDFVECWDFGLDLRKTWNQCFFQIILLWQELFNCFPKLYYVWRLFHSDSKMQFFLIFFAHFYTQ